LTTASTVDTRCTRGTHADWETIIARLALLKARAIGILARQRYVERIVVGLALITVLGSGIRVLLEKRAI
jgi:hypothetical protein